MNVKIEIIRKQYGGLFIVEVYCSKCGKKLWSRDCSFSRDRLSPNEKEVTAFVERSFNKMEFNYCNKCGSALEDKESMSGTVEGSLTEGCDEKHFHIKGLKTLYSKKPLKSQIMAQALAKLYSLEHPEEKEE